MLHLDKHHILCYNVCVIDFWARPSGHREFSHNAHVVIFVRGQYARPMSFCYGLILAIFIFYRAICPQCENEFGLRNTVNATADLWLGDSFSLFLFVQKPHGYGNK